jgi:hypothetical protein
MLLTRTRHAPTLHSRLFNNTNTNARVIYMIITLREKETRDRFIRRDIQIRFFLSHDDDSHELQLWKKKKTTKRKNGGVLARDRRFNIIQYYIRRPGHAQ